MGVGRPWGVTLFWVLLCLVVPAAVFRIGMAVVDRVRPRPAGAHRMRRPAAPRRTAPTSTDATTSTTSTTAVLPWFTPDSAPSENRPRPTTKGQA
ncbi:hypothetical protein GA0115253_1027329 [Streptomyces sp. Termitarium-T10T-6]|nr:hypothetical protein GA0115253_1027329 [Streptomyces sp. Termitarium-T10T-6]